MVQTAAEESEEKETDGEGGLAHVLVAKGDKEADKTREDDRKHTDWGPARVEEV